MKLNISKVIVRVDFGEYASEMAGQYLHVWLNPSLETLRKHDELIKPKPAPEAKKKNAEELKKELQAREDEMKQWYAEIWSQGPAEAHWTADELRELEEKDPTLLTWMINSTWEKRNEHISRKKKS